MSNPQKIALITIISVIGGLLLLTFILFFGISRIYFHIAFKRKNPNQYTSIIYDTDKKYYHWYENKNTSDVYIETFDKTKLSAKLVKNDSHLYYLVIHGYKGMFISRMPIAKVVFDKYKANVLAINQRGHYTSGGKYNSLGYLESKDLKYWVDYIISIDNEAKIILDGVSMGATTIMYGLNNYEFKHVIGAVCDCGFYSWYEEILKDYKKVNKFLFIFAKSFLKLFYKTRYKVDLGKLNCYEGLSKSKIPVLFIHAKDDPVVPYDDHIKECEAFNKNTYYQVLEFEDGGHARTFYRHNEEYIESLCNFINTLLKEEINEI